MTYDQAKAGDYGISKEFLEAGFDSLPNQLLSYVTGLSGVVYSSADLLRHITYSLLQTPPDMRTQLIQTTVDNLAETMEGPWNIESPSQHLSRLGLLQVCHLVKEHEVGWCCTVTEDEFIKNPKPRSGSALDLLRQVVSRAFDQALSEVNAEYNCKYHLQQLLSDPVRGPQR